MGVTAEHYADISTYKQIDKPRNQQKQRNPTYNHKRTAKYQLLYTLDAYTDAPFQFAQPAAVMDESDTVKWNTGKLSTEKAELQQSGQPVATTNCAHAGQSQSMKPRISTRI